MIVFKGWIVVLSQEFWTEDLEVGEKYTATIVEVRSVSKQLKMT